MTRATNEEREKIPFFWARENEDVPKSNNFLYFQETMNSVEFPALAAPMEFDEFSIGWAGVELDFLCVSTSVVSAPSRWLFSCCVAVRSVDLPLSFFPWLFRSAWKYKLFVFSVQKTNFFCCVFQLAWFTALLCMFGQKLQISQLSIILRKKKPFPLSLHPSPQVRHR